MVAEPPLSRMRATNAARLAAVLPSVIMASTASVRNFAISRAERPSEPVTRTISPWLMGMPENIWSRYSPMPIFTRSASGLPEFSGFGQARCVGAEFANTFGIGGEPSEAVGGMLLGLKLLRRDLPIGGENLRANAAGRLGDEGLSSFAGAPGEGQEILRFGGDGRGSGHGSNLSNQNEGWRSL